MNCRKCLKKAFGYMTVVVLSLFFFTSYTHNALATFTSITLSPATGTIYGSNTPIGVYVNSGTDEFAGVDINLAFTGSVDFVSATGAARCSSFNVTEGTGTVNIECLSLNHATGEAYNGVVGTLYFKATAVGSSVFTITSVDPETTTKTGGTYTLVTSSAPAGGSDLPDSGLFDDSLNRIVLGGVFLVIGIFFSSKKSLDNYDFLGKVKEVRQEKKDERLEKKRSKWESKF